MDKTELNEDIEEINNTTLLEAANQSMSRNNKEKGGFLVDR